MYPLLSTLGSSIISALPTTSSSGPPPHQTSPSSTPPPQNTPQTKPQPLLNQPLQQNPKQAPYLNYQPRLNILQKLLQGVPIAGHDIRRYGDGLDARVVDAALDSKEAALPPLRPPAVLQAPELRPVLLTVADQQHGMIDPFPLLVDRITTLVGPVYLGGGICLSYVGHIAYGPRQWRFFTLSRGT